LPPIVPRVWICSAPTSRAAAGRIGQVAASSADVAIARQVVPAPMRAASASTLMPANRPAMSRMPTGTGLWCAATSRSVPPASTR
jgi:hypothetical protein